MKAKPHIDQLILDKTRSSVDVRHLDPDKVSIDSRSTAELMAWMAKISRQFWYYDNDDRKNGDWSAFFDTEILCMLAKIGDADHDQQLKKILDLKKGVCLTKGRQHQSDMLWQYFYKVFQIVFEINDWYKSLTIYYPNHSFLHFLKQTIWNKLSFILRDIYTYYHLSIQQEILNDKEKIDTQFRQFEELDVLWNFNPFPLIKNEKNHVYHFRLDTRGFMQSANQAVRRLFGVRQKIKDQATSTFKTSLTTRHTSPHIGLIVAFLKLFKNEQQQLNQIPSRFLDFYYHKVLDFGAGNVTPDTTTLLIKLNKSCNSLNIPQGTSFVGSSDNHQVIFDTVQDTRLSNASLKDYWTLSRSRKSGIYSSKISNFNQPNYDKDTGALETFNMFGSSSGALNSQNSIGLIISSPDLLMGGGDRCLRILTLSEKNNVKPSLDVSNSKNSLNISGTVKVELTSKKGWISPDRVDVFYYPSAGFCEFKIDMKASSPSVVAYDPAVHGKGFQSQWPMVRLTLVAQSIVKLKSKSVSSYQFWNYQSFSSIQIESVVTDLPPELVVNSSGKAPVSSAISAFGNVPAVGNRLVMGSYEVFSKHLQTLQFSLDWQNIPENFNVYYNAYNFYLNKYFSQEDYFNDDAFTAEIEILIDSMDWQAVSEEQPVFSQSPISLLPALCKPEVSDNKTPSSQTGKDEKAVRKTGKSIIYEAALKKYTPPEWLSSPLSYNEKSKGGFIGLKLTGPEHAFGQDIYPQVVADATLAKTINASKQIAIISALIEGIGKLVIGIIKKLTPKFIKKWFAKHEKQKDYTTLPNKPLVPKFKGITLNYTAKRSIELGTTTDAILYQIHPFGSEILTKSTVKMIPDYPKSGYTFWSFDQLQSNAILTLFLAIADRQDAEIGPQKRTFTLDVLQESGWEPVKIVKDGTFNLNSSGILEVWLDDKITNEQTIMPGGCYWIRLGGDANQIKDCKLSMLGLNAITVKRQVTSNQLLPKLTHISPSTISALLNPIPEITKIEQPYASFGGLSALTGKDQQKSISDRLFNKNRGGSANAIASLVFSQFPSIYQVKLTRSTSKIVKLRVVPCVTSSRDVNAFEPVVASYKLDSIYEFLKPRISAQLPLEIENAGFESICFGLAVDFKSSEMEYAYEKQLNADLKCFLSPWIEDNQMGVSQSSLAVDRVYKFLEDQSYIVRTIKLQIELDGITIYDSSQEDAVKKRSMKIRPVQPGNILVSATKHKINTPKMMNLSPAKTPTT